MAEESETSTEQLPLLPEEQLRASEERFRLLVEGAKDYAMFLLDRNSRITFWSTGAERLFGWTDQEALGQPGAMIFTPEGRQRGEPEREVNIALAEGRAEDRRWHIKKDNTRFWADGLLMRLDHENGELRGFAKIARDATRQKQAEDELRASAEALRQSEEATSQANEALEQANLDLENRVNERTQELTQALAVVETAMAERQELLRKLVQAQEEERHRLSRELHDIMSQHITAFSLRLQALSIEHPKLASALEQLQDIASDIGKEAHRLAVELRPPSLDDLGLVPALKGYIQEWQKRTPIAVQFVANVPARRLSPEAEVAVYRAVQEALANLVKHAATATQANIILQPREDMMQIIIEDNGPGFDRALAVRSGRLGLRGIRERVELVGGVLEIESTPGEGTTLFLRVPFPVSQSS